MKKKRGTIWELQRKAVLGALLLYFSGAGLSGCGQNGDAPASTQQITTQQTVTQQVTVQEDAGKEGQESSTAERDPSTEAEQAYVFTETDENTISFSVPGGCYEEDFLLEICSDDQGVIYYTLDGSNPIDSESRRVYQGGIEITDRVGDANVVSAVDPALFDTAHCKFNKTTKKLDCYATAPKNEDVDKCMVVKAVSVRSDQTTSQIYSQTYFIGDMQSHISGLSESCEAAGTKLAVISITMDYQDLFDPETGIYVLGNRFEDSWNDYVAGGACEDDGGRKLDANYSMRGREWERRAYVDFYECDASGMQAAFSQSCGIRIQGNYSRSDLQKGFRLYAREEYGAKKFRYPVFGEEFVNDQNEVMGSFKTLTLRNGGNFAFVGKFNDAFWQELASELACDTQKNRPAVVYLNGEYWGLYVLEEDYSEQYFQDNHGVDKEEVVLYKGDAERYDTGYKLDVGKLPEGETDDGYYFKDLYAFFDQHTSCKEEEDYEKLASLVDPQSCMDYFAMQCWIDNKWDWPGKNWSMWKIKEAKSEEEIEQNPYLDGKFRFCFYDMEFGGCNGMGDVNNNTIQVDNYKKHGLLDTNTGNPAVLSFAYFMTNDGFRRAFIEKLQGMADQEFELQHANAVLTNYESIYVPLLDQFYKRYPGSGKSKDAVEGGFGSTKLLRAFLAQRRNQIGKQIQYIIDYLGE